MVFCDDLRDRPVENLIKLCSHCDKYFVHCCHCEKLFGDRPLPCHHFRIIFVRGACTANRINTVGAGFGFNVGSDQGSRWANPVTEENGHLGDITIVRAQLLAAIEGVRAMSRLDKENHWGVAHTTRGKAWIIATDTDWVMKGMTEGLPSWKVPCASSLSHLSHVLQETNLTTEKRLAQ